MTTTEQRLRAALEKVAEPFPDKDLGDPFWKYVADEMRDIAREALAAAPEDEGWRLGLEAAAAWHDEQVDEAMDAESVTQKRGVARLGLAEMHEYCAAEIRALRPLPPRPLDLHEEGKR